MARPALFLLVRSGNPWSTQQRGDEKQVAAQKPCHWRPAGRRTYRPTTRITGRQPPFDLDLSPTQRASDRTTNQESTNQPATRSRNKETFDGTYHFHGRNSLLQDAETSRQKSGRARMREEARRQPSAGDDAEAAAAACIACGSEAERASGRATMELADGTRISIADSFDTHTHTHSTSRKHARTHSAPYRCGRLLVRTGSTTGAGRTATKKSGAGTRSTYLPCGGGAGVLEEGQERVRRTKTAARATPVHLWHHESGSSEAARSNTTDQTEVGRAGGLPQPARTFAQNKSQPTDGNQAQNTETETPRLISSREAPLPSEAVL